MPDTKAYTFSPDDFDTLPPPSQTEAPIVRKQISYWRGVWLTFRKNKTALVSLVIICLLILFVLVGPFMNPFDYRTNDYSHVNQSPDSVHWFGTDNMGRDIWTRVWEGGRISLLIAVLATLIPEIIGMIIGGISGYFGGWLDTFIMRLIDVLMGIPSLIYMILLMLVFGSGSVMTLIIAMSLTGWMGSARATRGLVLQIKARDFVTASETLGAPAWWIILKRLIPNTLGIRVVGITMSIPSVIFYESFLSYIGLGVTPPTPSWGQLIKAAGENFRYYPYQFIIPCAMVGITMLCFNLVGDGLRDALDPKLRG
ncbi:MAG: ABC transporter permease [Clostridia bacterium]|nr:ABC transporter permease [Clostridia bacterium]